MFQTGLKNKYICIVDDFGSQTQEVLFDLFTHDNEFKIILNVKVSRNEIEL